MTEILAAAVGGMIAILAVLLGPWAERRRRSKSIRVIAVAEISSMYQKAKKFSENEISEKELSATSPMLVSVASEIGFLSQAQAVAYRLAVVSFSELKASKKKERAQETIQACEDALAKF